MSYSELLKDPRWQKKRLDILSRDNFKCVSCDDDKSTLHVHHHYYIDGRLPWEYPSELLVTLCYQCHSDEECFKECDNDIVKIFLSSGILRWDIQVLLSRICGKLSHGDLDVIKTPREWRTEFHRIMDIIFEDGQEIH